MSGEYSENAENAAWIAHTTAVIRGLARRGEPFSIDDVRLLVDEPPTTGIWGPPFQWVRAEGAIEPVGAVYSRYGVAPHFVRLWLGSQFVTKTEKAAA